ncbi:transketolase [Hymenobacter lapidiphilus]|uniref:Transketolase n=1 Tax=Hymenobacter lapidiphilus TaxID=2608003 RepID=A0A7Y7U568_9BACT|nr:transketolase [Hymenobacter lapidiphilus]NVO31138.1 transketolase [Hymenobacter lapidiphilus]
MAQPTTSETHAPATTKSIPELKQIATQVRRDIVRMVHAVNSGHPGGSLGCTELLVSLYFKVMKHTPEPFDMDGINQDLFFLSNGHISPVFYSVLARSGYFPVSELATFRKLNSRLQGHPATHEHLPGIRIASGSLGQGLSVATGAAQAKKLNGDNSTVFVLMGDGELQEGQIWEAALYAPHHKVDNLIAFVDRNGQQIDGPTAKIGGLGDLRAKFEAFGWRVLETDGNQFETLLPTIEEAQNLLGQGVPVMVLMDTEMGFGIDFMMGSHKWHGVAPNDEQLATALLQLEVEKASDY